LVHVLVGVAVAVLAPLTEVKVAVLITVGVLAAFTLGDVTERDLEQPITVAVINKAKTVVS
jgi:hypothetical protein